MRSMGFGVWAWALGAAATVARAAGALAAAFRAAGFGWGLALARADDVLDFLVDVLLFMRWNLHQAFTGGQCARAVHSIFTEATHATDEGSGEDARTGAGGTRRHRRRRDAASGAGLPRGGGREDLLRVGPQGPQGPQRAREPAARPHRRSLLGRLVAHLRGDGAGPRARDRARPALPRPAPPPLRKVSAVSARGRARRDRFGHRRAAPDARLLLLMLTRRRVIPPKGSSWRLANRGTDGRFASSASDLRWHVGCR